MDFSAATSLSVSYQERSDMLQVGNRTPSDRPIPKLCGSVIKRDSCELERPEPCMKSDAHFKRLARALAKIAATQASKNQRTDFCLLNSTVKD
jgi:hypothetical protein